MTEPQARRPEDEAERPACRRLLLIDLVPALAVLGGVVVEVLTIIHHARYGLDPGVIMVVAAVLGWYLLNRRPHPVWDSVRRR